MRMPKDDQIDLAILWLQHNEGDDREAEACKAVIEWLDHMKLEETIKSAARASGMTLATVRRRLIELADTRTSVVDEDNDHVSTPRGVAL